MSSSAALLTFIRHSSIVFCSIEFQKRALLCAGSFWSCWRASIQAFCPVWWLLLVSGVLTHAPYPCSLDCPQELNFVQNKLTVTLCRFQQRLSVHTDCDLGNRGLATNISCAICKDYYLGLADHTWTFHWESWENFWGSTGSTKFRTSVGSVRQITFVCFPFHRQDPLHRMTL